MAGSASPDEKTEQRLDFQPDIYQRYMFLRGLATSLHEPGTGREVTVLDVGAGPERLTETFLGPGYDVTRADVSQFDDPDIRLIVPGQPLPFESGSFDLAIALEVLEHLSADARPFLIRELQRVSRRAVIVCCPVGTPETVAAEAQFSGWARRVAGRDLDFLEEHRDRGLPDPADVAAAFARPEALLVADNSPLDDWLAFNLIDLIYSADWGDTEAKHAFDRSVNLHTRFSRPGHSHYRRFFCAFAEPAARTAAERFILEMSSASDGHDAPVVSQILSAILTLRERALARASADLAVKDAAAHQLEEHAAGLNRELEAFVAAAAEKDRHIAKLDAHAAAVTSEHEALHTELHAKDAHIRKLDEHLSQQRLELEGIRSQHGLELDGIRSEHGLELEALRATVAARDAQLEDLHRQVASLHAAADLAAADISTVTADLEAVGIELESLAGVEARAGLPHNPVERRRHPRWGRRGNPAGSASPPPYGARRAALRDRAPGVGYETARSRGGGH